MWGSFGVRAPQLFDALLASPHEDPAKPEFTDTGIACYDRTSDPPEISCVQIYAQAP